MSNLTKMLFKNGIIALMENGKTFDESFDFAFENMKNEATEKPILDDLKSEMKPIWERI